MKKHLKSRSHTLPREVLRSPRCARRPLDQYKALLRLDWDWSSTGIWHIEEPGARSLIGIARYADLNLSPGLVGRFNLWTDWHELCHVRDRHRQADWELLGLYGWALAIDLKRELGDDYYVEYRLREIHDDIAYLLREF